MCDPTGLTEAAIGLTIASAGAGYYAQQQQQSAINTARNQYQNNTAAAIAANQASDEKSQSQKNAVLSQSMNNAGLGNQQAQVAAKTQQLATDYNATTAKSPADTPGGSLTGTNAAQQANPNNATSNSVVGAAYDQQYSKLNSYLGQQANAKAALDAQSAQNVQNSVYNSNQQNSLNLTNDIAQGNNQLLQNQESLYNEMYQNNVAAAQQKGQLASLFGSLLSGAASATGSAGVGQMYAGALKGASAGAGTAAAIPQFNSTVSIPNNIWDLG